MNIYKIKMWGYKIVFEEREIKVKAENASAAEELAKNDWYEDVIYEGHDFEGGAINTESIELIEKNI